VSLSERRDIRGRDGREMEKRREGLVMDDVQMCIV